MTDHRLGELGGDGEVADAGLLVAHGVTGVAAGLHLLIPFPGAPDLVDADLAEQAGRAGVLVHPLSWHRQHSGPPGLVLGYAAHPPDRLRDAVHRIATAMRSKNQTSR